MDDIPIRVHLWRLFCYHGADEGASEPYLWVIGFKFDGSTMQQQLTRLSWTPDYFFSHGSHGNLGTNGVNPGAKIKIPANVGSWETTLKPIRLTDLQGNSTDVPGAVGFAAVLLEEDNVPDDAAEAGHQALNNFVASTLEAFVTGINLVEFNQAVQGRVDAGAARDKAIEAELRARFDAVRQTITDGASDVVSNAIRNAMNLPEMIWAGIDKDDVMGRAFQLATASQLIGEGDFTLDFTDGMFDNPALPEAGNFGYNLHSYIKARVKWQAIPSQLPADQDIAIQGITRGFSRDRRSYYIASVGGVVNGQSWWMRRSEACSMIQNGEKAFYVLNGDGSHTPVSVVSPPGSFWSYLTTPADDRPENNLLALPKLNELPGFRSAMLVPDPFG